VRRPPDQSVLATVDALDVEFLSGLNLIALPQLGRQHDPASTAEEMSVASDTPAAMNHFVILYGERFTRDA
jgi:hypothetical protein